MGARTNFSREGQAQKSPQKDKKGPPMEIKVAKKTPHGEKGQGATAYTCPHSAATAHAKYYYI